MAIAASRRPSALRVTPLLNTARATSLRNGISPAASKRSMTTSYTAIAASLWPSLPPLIHERRGDPRAQCRPRWWCRSARQLVVDSDLGLVAADLAERNPLIEQRQRDLCAGISFPPYPISPYCGEYTDQPLLPEQSLTVSLRNCHAQSGGDAPGLPVDGGNIG